MCTYNICKSLLNIKEVSSQSNPLSKIITQNWDFCLKPLVKLKTFQYLLTDILNYYFIFFCFSKISCDFNINAINIQKMFKQIVRLLFKNIKKYWTLQNYKIIYLGSLLKSSLGKIVITVIFVKDHQLAQILSTSFNRVVNWYLYDQMKIK